MTLSLLLADCYRRLSYSATPATEVTTRLTAFLNETQDEILSRPGMSQLLRNVTTFPSVANQAEYALMQPLNRVLQMRDLTNMLRLNEVSASFYRSILPDPSRQTGTSYAYALLGLEAVMVDTTVSTLGVVSTDNTAGEQAALAYVELLMSDGTIYKTSRTVAGTSGGLFTLPSGLTVNKVLDFYVNTAAVGTISLSEALTAGPTPHLPAGAIFAYISQGNFRAYYQKIALIPTPSSVITYTVDCELQNQPMVNTTDSPVLPQMFHRILPIGARKKEYEFKGDSERRDMASAEWEREVGFVNDFLVNPPDQSYVNGRIIAGPSVLPPWFPQSGYLQ